MTYKVSFCIPVYNNAKGVSKLVKALLNNDCREVQVVVVDNASNDDIVEKMARIDDDRLKFVVNDSNVGAKMNWYHALEAGDGEWLYLVMGRDMLEGKYIKRLLGLLGKVDERIGYLFDRNKDMFPLLYSENTFTGIEAVIEFIDMLHPTGSIFRRKAYKGIKNRKAYFEKEHPYPENYIKRDIFLKNDAAYIDAKLYCGKTNVREPKSHFEKTKIPYYYPQKRLEQFVTDIHMIEFSGKCDYTKKENNRFFIKRWRSLLYIVSIEWKNSLEATDFTDHYNTKKRCVRKVEMIGNILMTYKKTRSYYSRYHKLEPSRNIKMFLSVLRQILFVTLYNKRFSLQNRPVC